MTENKQPRKSRTYVYNELEHQKAVRHEKILAEVKELIKPINNRLSKLRADRLLKK